ncbi:MAG: hypothetical protein DCF15_15715 [Phormidesmis priestleyi]|uniref:Alpha/beta hydrolase n=1 Tax=Phormidesmis priestleyi TaxID=268141 RepID=A0A2W4X185_9CYAN|nr:MAG: hypothetical protein DCF15_15715 [Phormidesmis priestleyi]
MRPIRFGQASYRATVLPLLLLALATGLMVSCWPLGSNLDSRFHSQETMAASAAQPYPYTQISKQLVGDGASAYWVFQPEATKPLSAPVVLFLHGWMAMDPYPYGGWIDHLAKSGNIVVYPVFQTSRNDTPEEMQENALRAIREAIRDLDNNPIRPDWNQFSIVGHSLGGGLSALVAANAQSVGLPMPQVIMAVAPGWTEGELPTAELSQISSSSYLIIVEGADDELAESRQGANIYRATPQIPSERKAYFVLASGDDNLEVTHSSPLSPLESYRNADLSRREVRQQRFGTFFFNVLTGQNAGTIDQLDSAGYWPIFDSARQAAASGRPALSVADNFSQVTGSGNPDSPQRLVVE